MIPTINLLAVFCLLIQAPRLFFVNRLPHYGDTSFFQYFSKFGYKNKQADILYLTATRVPILWYYGMLQYIASCLKLEFHKFEQLHHLLLIALESFLIGLLAQSYGFNPFLAASIFSILNLPPRSYSYFGSGEIFIGLFDCLFLVLLHYASINIVIDFSLGLFCTWYLASIKFLYLPRWIIYAIMVSWNPLFLIGSCIGLILWLLPFKEIGFSLIMKTVRSYKSVNDRQRKQFFTPIQRDFFLMHGVLLIPLCLVLTGENSAWMWPVVAMYVWDWLVIFVQHNGYNYMALPLFSKVSLMLLLIDPIIAIFCLLSNLFFASRNGLLRCYPVEWYRNEQLLHIYYQIGQDIKTYLTTIKSKLKRPVFAFGKHTTIHVISETPYFRDEHYAHIQIQDEEVIEEIYPDWKSNLARQICEHPPEVFLQNLDNPSLISKQNLEKLTGYSYRLLSCYHLTRIRVYVKQDKRLSNPNGESKDLIDIYQKQAGAQVANFNFLRRDHINQLEQIAVVDSPAETNLQFEGNILSVDEFLKYTSHKPAHYFLLTEKNQNNILEQYRNELEKKTPAYLITKCA